MVPSGTTANYFPTKSFSTDPPLKLWLVELPWIGLGYRWGGPFSGLRLSLSFPF